MPVDKRQQAAIEANHQRIAHALRIDREDPYRLIARGVIEAGSPSAKLNHTAAVRSFVGHLRAENDRLRCLIEDTPPSAQADAAGSLSPIAARHVERWTSRLVAALAHVPPSVVDSAHLARRIDALIERKATSLAPAIKRQARSAP